MAITIDEKPNSREYDNSGSVTFHYIIMGSTDDIAITAALLADTIKCPVTYNNLFREQYPHVFPIFVDTINDTGHWEADVKYTVPSGGQAIAINGLPSPSFSFDFAGGTQHITNSKVTIAAYTTADTAINPAHKSALIGDYGNLIGVGDNGEVDGVDIDIPAFNFSVTYYKTTAEMTTYITGLYALAVAPVNNASVTLPVGGNNLTFAKGEVRLVGMSGSYNKATGNWEITLKFSAIKNQTGLTIGGIINIAKEGWQYIWIKYAAAIIPGTKQMGKLPYAAYVEKVYEYGDMSVL
jgi:hypothetical protein